MGCTKDEEAAVDLDALFSAYFDALGPTARAQAIDAIVAAGIPTTDVAARLRAGQSYLPDVTAGWQVFDIDSIDGQSRPFHVYVPTGYDPAASHPLLVYLHGAVSGTYTVEQLAPRRSVWEESAEELGYLILMPHGDAGATWWSRTGHANIRSELAFLKRTYNIDEDRVFLSGFSDGGSGAYWFAFHDPTPWAGFLAWYGNPSIPDMGPYPCYPRNLYNRPIRATNGVSDELYPASEMYLYMAQIRSLGVDIAWQPYETSHDFTFFPEEKPRSLEFVAATIRDPAPSVIVWETADTAVGRCDWVRIDEIADVGNDRSFEDANLLYLAHVLQLGAVVGECTEAGCTVVGIVPGSAAHAVGLRAGDLIVRVDGFLATTREDIYLAFQSRAPGDQVELEIVRGGQAYSVTASVPSPLPLYGRERMTGSIQVAANANRIEVTVRHVAQYTLFLSSEQFDLDRPIEVITNGQPSLARLVEPDARFMLEQAAEDLDRRTVYEAKDRDCGDARAPRRQT